jgi:hypothetical protein
VACKKTKPSKSNSPDGHDLINHQLNTQLSHPLMNPINLHTPVPSPQTLPLALALPSRLLLTEKSSVTAKFISTGMKMETLELRATMVTTVLKDIAGYSHYGINE